MHKPSTGVVRVLVCRVQSRLCGLPLDAVEETLRPQPLRPLSAAVVHVQGLARIRGDWVPVVDLAGLLGLTAAPVGRYVVVRAGGRRVALAVAQVLGLQALAEDAVSTLPPLLRDSAHGAVAALAERDDELIAVLDEARLLPDDWLAALPGSHADSPTSASTSDSTAASSAASAGAAS